MSAEPVLLERGAELPDLLREVVVEASATAGSLVVDEGAVLGDVDGAASGTFVDAVEALGVAGAEDELERSLLGFAIGVPVDAVVVDAALAGSGAGAEATDRVEDAGADVGVGVAAAGALAAADVWLAVLGAGAAATLVAGAGLAATLGVLLALAAGAAVTVLAGVAATVDVEVGADVGTTVGAGVGVTAAVAAEGVRATTALG